MGGCRSGRLSTLRTTTSYKSTAPMRLRLQALRKRLGLGYIIKDESISICASSKHRQTSRLMHTLESYLFETRP
jgi:hypothetical protein